MKDHYESRDGGRQPAGEDKPFDWFAAAHDFAKGAVMPISKQDKAVANRLAAEGFKNILVDLHLIDESKRCSLVQSQSYDQVQKSMASAVASPLPYNQSEKASIAAIEKTILSGDLKAVKTELEKYGGSTNSEKELGRLMRKVSGDLASRGLAVETKMEEKFTNGCQFSRWDQETSIAAKTLITENTDTVIVPSEKAHKSVAVTWDNRPDEHPVQTFKAVIAKAKAAH